MSQDNSPIDVAQAHRYFSADCYNNTWKLIESPIELLRKMIR
ncbi:MAG TPA: hypothetical protein VGG19_03875 [Tepidisphaeraceae bacterium]